MQPGVSVVIPTYNRAEQVVQAVRSALAQDWNSIQVLVVDDASTDDTRERVLELAREDERVRLVAQERNQGPSAARNRGIDEAMFPVVAFLDSDNSFQSDKLKRQMPAFLDAGKNAVSFTAYLADQPDRTDEVLLDSWDPSPLAVIQELLVGCCVNTSTVIADRELLRTRGRFRTDLSCCEDHDLWLRLAVTGHPFVYQREPLTRYRVHEGSLSASNAAVAECSERVITNFLAREDLPPGVRANRRRYLSRWAFVGAELYVGQRMPGQALRALARAVRARPASARPGWLLLAASALSQYA
jgi:glycosyltransferase involved in cell wall biosynthesis